MIALTNTAFEIKKSFNQVYQGSDKLIKVQTNILNLDQ